MTVVTVSTNQTWTCPAGCLYIALYMKGGGAGGGAGGNYYGGNGGGEGGVINESLYAVTPGVVYQCVVGTGGARNTAGGNAIFKDGSGNPLKTAIGGATGAATSGNIQGANGQGTNGGAGGDGDYPTAGDGAAGTLGCGGGGGGASLGSAGNGGVGGAGIFTITYVLPSTDFSADVTTGSKPLTVNWTNSTTTSGTTTYQWYWGDGNGSTDADPADYTYTTSGTFTVTLTASTVYGYDTETKVGYITVLTQPYCCSFIIMTDNLRGV